MPQTPPATIRDTTPEAVAAARALLAGATHGALATISPADGHPIATRVGLALLPDGTPVILVSALAAHTPALRAEPRCSLLVGEPGRGDPLAHPRLTLRCRATDLGRAGDAAGVARAAYLARHPKAKLYADLPDFTFMRLDIEDASFNAGFGRAYQLTRGELCSI